MSIRSAERALLRRRARPTRCCCCCSSALCYALLFCSLRGSLLRISQQSTSVRPRSPTKTKDQTPNTRAERQEQEQIGTARDGRTDGRDERPVRRTSSSSIGARSALSAVAEPGPRVAGAHGWCAVSYASLLRTYLFSSYQSTSVRPRSPSKTKDQRRNGKSTSELETHEGKGWTAGRTSIRVRVRVREAPRPDTCWGRQSCKWEREVGTFISGEAETANDQSRRTRPHARTHGQIQEERVTGKREANSSLVVWLQTRLGHASEGEAVWSKGEVASRARRGPGSCVVRPS